MAENKKAAEDAAVEQEIAELRNNPHVLLAMRMDEVRGRRRQELAHLRALCVAGQVLAESGVTLEQLESWTEE